MRHSPPQAYTYEDSEEAFPFYINRLDHNELNQDCVWNKHMNTPAWMNVAQIYKSSGAPGAQLGIHNTCSGNPNDITGGLFSDTSPLFGCLWSGQNQDKAHSRNGRFVNEMAYHKLI